MYVTLRYMLFSVYYVSYISRYVYNYHLVYIMVACNYKYLT